MGVIGDIAVAADGRAFEWWTRDEAAAEWCQDTRQAAGFCRGTYRYNARAGFPSVYLLSNPEAADQIGAIVKYFLLDRPDVAEVSSVEVTRPDPDDPRHYQIRASVRLRGGQVTELVL